MIRYAFELWEQSLNDTTRFMKVLVSLNLHMKTWVTLFSVNSKSIHKEGLKEKPMIWSDIFRWKFEILELLLDSYTIHLWLVFLNPFGESVLKFSEPEFGIPCPFNVFIGIWHIRYFFFIFSQPSERPALKMYIIWYKTEKSLMLGNQFPVLFLCKLKHMSVYFIQNGAKINCK